MLETWAENGGGFGWFTLSYLGFIVDAGIKYRQGLGGHDRRLHGEPLNLRWDKVCGEN
jgi:hypothetical protein